MSDFDQLIKEKVNSKEYTYSAKNWQSFTQKAGWKGSFTLLHGLLTGAAVIVVAVGIYVGVRLSGAEVQQPTPPAQNKPVTETVMEQDSIVELDKTGREVVTESKSESLSIVTTPHNNGKAPKTETSPAEVSATDMVKEEPDPVQKPVRRERITHIFEINTDTIPSNDF